MDPISIITGLATVVPSIVRWIGGDKAGDVADKAVSIAQSITGEADPATALERLKAEQDYQLKFQAAWASFEQGIQEQLTRRHEADMKSDSRLSKNVRPLCLLVLTCAIVFGLYVPGVDSTKFKSLVDMANFVYGYYFIGRSAEWTVPAFGRAKAVK
ncbi:hypothetical protein ACR42D_10040 [Desulfovibrio caledoniensis]